MKKTFCLFGVTLMTATMLVSCSKEEVVEKPKNYFGTDPVGDGTPKEAYYAFFGAILFIVVLLAWGLKKMREGK